jgi:tRNA pseudouridine13 synthase
VYVADLKAELQLGSVQLTFTLPAGSYATVLLSEIMKVWVPEEEVAAPD